MAEQNSSISNFRRFLTRILLPLILIVSVAGAFLDYFFGKKIILCSELCGAYKVNRILTETHLDEIPIFGSSRAEGSFIPDSLGSNYFDYGLSGTKCDVLLFFLEQECRKTKHKPSIILNLDLEGIIYGTGDLANYVPDGNYTSVQELLGKDYKAYYHIPFIRYYGFFETYTRNYLNNKLQLTKFSNKGAALEKNIQPGDQFQALITERRNTTTIFEADSALTVRLTAMITSHPSRNFIFVVAPYHNSYFERFPNLSDARHFLDMLRTYKNVRVFDFSTLPLSDNQFLNTSHVNYKGAIIFNRCLRDSLRAIGVY